MLTRFKEKYIGDAAFYKRYLYLALPMILQNAITNLVSFLDNIMVGQLGTEQMSGVAIVNQLIFVYNLAIFGAASAASIFGAQYYGKGNHKGHMYSFRFKLYATLLVTGLTILLFVTKGADLISLYLTDTAGSGATEVALQYGLEYLGIMMVGLIPFAVNQSYATNIKETGQTLVPMIASFVAVGSNAVLDYLFIFGIGPFPELGVSGAAAATVTAQALVSLLFFKAVLREKVLFPHLRLWVLVPVKVWREIVRIGVPSAVQNLIYAGISMILTRLITGWGDLAVAAQRVGSQIESVSWMVGDGFSAAVNAFLGQNYGAKRYDRVRRGYFCAIAMTAAWGLCTTFLLIGMARPLFSIFLQEEEVMAIGVNYLRIVGLSQMFMMVEQTSIGAFSGLGRTLYPSIVSVTFTSARIPVAVLLSSVMGLSGIWWALSISSMVKGCILFVRFVVCLYVFLERKKDEKTV